MRKKVNKKLIVALLSFVLLFGGTFGSSLAWLLDRTGDVKNTFTTSNIDILLEETKPELVDGERKAPMIPGCTIEKDPTITVLKDSVDCWVFVEVIESENLDKYISYTIDPNNWNKLNGVDNVYVTKSPVTDITSDCRIKVLGYTDDMGGFHPNEVLVNETVEKEDMDALEADGAVLPTLTFKAYASQLMKNNTEEFTAKEAWGNLKTDNSDDTGSGEADDNTGDEGNGN